MDSRQHRREKMSEGMLTDKAQRPYMNVGKLILSSD